MEPMAIVTVTGGVLGPVFVLLSRIRPVVDFFRRLCDCLRHPQRRPARPVRALWKRAAADEQN
ncbi:Os09g0257900 [Oryza sativa Japonica Group]|jgi:hypothetical protein|uniref:Os09g0257900 protein n=6 Tax=Oryza TaxID=4527 RepID=A0A0N7KQF7_ORYSJ|nr:hypothetical protein EE612_046401 [Oryza sativa]KAF2915329.1 hypothetical protein DAI22_09g023250 [Oryza sativa Japonica Group]BAD23433.1 unknown protein [Oryza sativa Japonica Group]BAF24612.1 Os09g0257900 [Oryza sativa Japonica Group]BAT07090.1 Os09g0257900 [Oryza sativa Japonica Group]|eukprot:NP_001062698.1 Os09g0257900 [Oryza sativa Japonica Group]